MSDKSKGTIETYVARYFVEHVEVNGQPKTTVDSEDGERISLLPGHLSNEILRAFLFFGEGNHADGVEAGRRQLARQLRNLIGVDGGLQ